MDLNTPVKIFELMFQSPENSVSQDDAHPNGRYISKPVSLNCIKCSCSLMEFFFPSSESLAEPFSLETSTQPVTDASSLISFTLNHTCSSSCSHTSAVMEAPSQLRQSSSSQASTPASVTATVSSAQPAPFLQLTGPQQLSDVPAQASVQAPNHVTPQHYVALPPTFLQPDSATQTTPLPQPISTSPPVASALTTTAPGTAAVSVVAATTTDALTAVAQPVPLANSSVNNTGPGLPTTSATITIAPTQNLLQPSLVMSDQNLQWILSSAANSQQNPEQAVSNAPTQRNRFYFTLSILLLIQDIYTNHIPSIQLEIWCKSTS